ncbi:MAG: hypothetical protein BBJ57_10490 [Desulfobacterales bacterium PC51MH44]|nr:MAG: hypothetical protein BBJ57_10490 [Desulfobacterales bacterium PC51MH44]
MHRKRLFTKYVSCFVTLTIVLMSMPIQTVCAAMVGTETVFTMAQVQNARKNLHVFLERRDIQAVMKAQGINPLEAKARVDCLSDAEAMRIADKMDQLPAGGGDFGTLVGAVLIVFIVLLLTDIMGYTDVFPFVKHQQQK